MCCTLVNSEAGVADISPYWDKREVWHGDFFLCVHINVLNVLYAFLCRVQYINVLDATASR